MSLLLSIHAILGVYHQWPKTKFKVKRKLHVSTLWPCRYLQSWVAETDLPGGGELATPLVKSTGSPTVLCEGMEAVIKVTFFPLWSIQLSTVVFRFITGRERTGKKIMIICEAPSLHSIISVSSSWFKRYFADLLSPISACFLFYSSSNKLIGVFPVRFSVTTHYPKLRPLVPPPNSLPPTWLGTALMA